MSVISRQFVSRVTLRRELVDSFARYPFSLPAIRTLEQLDLHPDDHLPDRRERH